MLENAVAELKAAAQGQAVKCKQLEANKTAAQVGQAGSSAAPTGGGQRYSCIPGRQPDKLHIHTHPLPSRLALRAAL